MIDLYSIYTTFVASIRSVGTACTMAMVGVYLHRRNFLIGESKRTLALISQQVTIPLFLFTKIVYCNQDWSEAPCPDITSKMQDVWILLFWPLYVVGWGLLVGYVASILSKTPREQRKSVLASCAFGNSTGLPITLLTVVHANFPDTTELGRVDPTLFLSVYLLLYPVLQWGVGGWLLAPPEEDDDDDDYEESVVGSPVPNGDTATTAASPPHSPLTHSMRHPLGSPPMRRNVLNNKSMTDKYKGIRRGIYETDASLYISNADLVRMVAPPPPTPPDYHQAPPQSPTGEGNDDDNDDDYQIHDYTQSTTPNAPLSPILQASTSSMDTNMTTPHQLRQLSYTLPSERQESEPNESSALLQKQHSSKFEPDSPQCGATFAKVATRCLQPPVVGALLGLLVAATPLRGIFVDLVNRRSAAPLEWLFDGLYAVGQAAVPINMMILGCNLSASVGLALTKPGSAALLSGPTMIAIVLGKMVVMPIIGIVTALLLNAYIWDIPDEINASFYLVAMIVFITPTANNVMVMVELSGSGTREGIAQVIAWQYAVAPILLSLTMTLVVGVASAWS